MLKLSLLDIMGMKLANPTDYDTLIMTHSYRQAINRVFTQYSSVTENTNGRSVPKNAVISRLLAGMTDANATIINRDLNLKIKALGNPTAPIIRKINTVPEQYGESQLYNDLIEYLISTLAGLTPELDKEIFGNNLNKVFIDLSYSDMKALPGDALSALSAAGADISKEQAVNMTGQFVSINGKPIHNNLPTYTGVDMRLIVMTPHVITELMTVTTLTYSLHSAVAPVKTLGRSSPKGFAYGDRTIAGTIIATISRQDTLIDMQPGIYTGDTKHIKSTHDLYRPYLMPDQLPLMDFIITFQNEVGDASALSIFGIKITDMGQVISMSDSILEVQYTYTALDVLPLRAIRDYTYDKNGVATGSTINVNNNEYLMMRNRVLSGMSMNRSPFEVIGMYNEMNDVVRQIAYMDQRRTADDKVGATLRGVARTDIARRQ